MNLQQLSNQIAEIEADVAARVGDTHSVDTLPGLETSVLAKTGSRVSLIKAVKDFPPEERGRVGHATQEFRGT